MALRVRDGLKYLLKRVPRLPQSKVRGEDSVILTSLDLGDVFVLDDDAVDFRAIRAVRHVFEERNGRVQRDGF